MELTGHFLDRAVRGLIKYRNTLNTLQNMPEEHLDVRYAQLLRMTMMTFCIMIFYIPGQFSMFIVNVDGLVLNKWEWGNLNHTPFKGTINVFQMAEAGIWFQYLAWLQIWWQLMMVLFWGFSSDAIDAYRRFAVRGGLAQQFPSLLVTKDPNRPDWIHRFGVWLRRGHFPTHVRKVCAEVKEDWKSGFYYDS